MLRFVLIQVLILMAIQNAMAFSVKAYKCIIYIYIYTHIKPYQSMERFHLRHKISITENYTLSIKYICHQQWCRVVLPLLN